MRFLPALLVIAIPVAAATARADGLDVKPGLWERTVTMRMQGAPRAMPDLGQLPPGQRAAMEKMIAERMGGQPSTSTWRECVTPEMLKKWESFAKDEHEDTSCERKLIRSTPQHVEMSLSCQGGQSNGTIRFDAQGPERMTGTIEMVHRQEGAERKMNMDVSSRWLGAECGDVKPGAPERQAQN